MHVCRCLEYEVVVVKATQLILYTVKFMSVAVLGEQLQHWAVPCLREGHSLPVAAALVYPQGHSLSLRLPFSPC